MGAGCVCIGTVWWWNVHSRAAVAARGSCQDAATECAHLLTALAHSGQPGRAAVAADGPGKHVPTWHHALRAAGCKQHALNVRHQPELVLWPHCNCRCET
jgi:hypothetical protein